MRILEHLRILLWEIAKLAQRKRITVDFGSSEWTLAVARAIAKLDFESDPADEIIAATSLVHRIPLVTRERRIRRSQLVPLAK